MKKQIVRYSAFIFLVLIQSVSLRAAVVIKGNSQVDGETFTFLIDKHVHDQLGVMRSRSYMAPGSMMFMAADAGAAGLSKEFAISALMRGKDMVQGITPEKIKILVDEKEKEVPNPLYDAGIKLLALLEDSSDASIKGDAKRPIVVVEGNPTTLYLINMYEHNFNQVLQVNEVKDANSNVTSGIVGIAGGPTGTIFATVGANGGVFGDVGSGIAVAILGVDKESTFFGDINATNGTRTGVGKAVALDRTSAALKIGADLANLGQIVDMHWDYTTGRLYLGMQATGGAAATDGARSVVVCRFSTQKDQKGITQTVYQLNVEEVAPAAAFTANNTIVGAQGANQAVTAHKVRTLFTSTGLNYMILLGGTDTPANTLRSVYALPVISLHSNQALNGTLAKKDAAPQEIYDAQTGRFLGRGFQTPVAAAADLPTDADLFARVGGGALPAGDIADMFVWRDTVFVTVADAVLGQKPGMFYSQALFNANGAIKGWTNWQRASVTLDNQMAADIDRVSGAFFDPATGESITLIPSITNIKTTVKRTQFANGDAKLSAPLLETLSQEFPQNTGGILGVQSIAHNAPGLNGTSLVLVTGDDKIALVENGRTNAAAYIPTSADEYAAIERFTNGAITQDFMGNPAKIVVVSGGALAEVGPLTAAEIAVNNANGWLFVGGVHGLAVLSRADGSGWDVGVGELSINFEDLLSDMTFKKIGDYSFVRKVIYDGNHFLYVLTDDRLDRIDLTMNNVGLNDLARTTLATRENLGLPRGTFFDCVVSQKLALLATSNGLYRVGNGANVQTAVDMQAVNWTRIALPTDADNPYRMQVISATGRAADVARGATGGIIYLLGADRGFESARLYRFAIEPVDAGAITDTTVQLMRDQFYHNEPSFLTAFNQFREHFFTDGVMQLHARSARGSSAPMVHNLPLETRSGVSLARLRLNSVALPIDLVGGLDMNALGRNAATGGYFVAGDFGMKMSE